ncbi:MAG: AmmeMemoRadiSam system protein A [bacterium]|nr:AmmeMemoRadiSam system protein A [bacterium]
MKPKFLNDEQKKKLLALARAELEHRLLQKEYDAEDYWEPDFELVRGCFVTLTLQGELRGCIGQLAAQSPLIELVPQMARAAAFEDPRFEPLNRSELNQISLEISLLSDPEPVEAEGIEGQLEALRPHVDGVILEAQGHRATFLPQVWEKVASKEEFMTALCQKASLPGDYWRSGPFTLYCYQAHHFEE